MAFEFINYNSFYKQMRHDPFFENQKNGAIRKFCIRYYFRYK